MNLNPYFNIQYTVLYEIVYFFFTCFKVLILIGIDLPLSYE